MSEPTSGRSTPAPDEQDIVFPKHVSTNRHINWVKKLSEYCIRHGICNNKDFFNRTTKDDDAMELLLALGMRNNWVKLLTSATKLVRDITVRPTFKERLEAHKFEKTDKGEEMYQGFYNVLRANNLQDKLEDIFVCMFNELGKRKTVYMQGPANSGKTAIMYLLSAFYEPWEIGKLSPQGINSPFWMQDLYRKELFCGDEILASQANIDAIKMLFEGNPNLATDIKFEDKQPIDPKPVIAACNDPIWRLMSTAERPIKARCVFLEFIKTVGMVKKLVGNEIVLHGPKEDLQHCLYALWRYACHDEFLYA